MGHWRIIAVVFLFGVAALNLRAVLVANPDVVVAPAAFRARLLGPFLNIGHAWAITAVGMLFALSFDTVSQAALFALAAGRFGGMWYALFVAGLSVLGMLTVDGANGLWINRLIRRADRTAVIASRVMALTVAGISLSVGVLTATRCWCPRSMPGRKAVNSGSAPS